MVAALQAVTDGEAMLTREEQESVMNRVRVIRTESVRLRRMVDRKEMDDKRYRELIQRAEDGLRDLLKELG